MGKKVRTKLSTRPKFTHGKLPYNSRNAVSKMVVAH